MDATTWRDFVEQYEDMLDESYGLVNVAGYWYATSDLLRSADPIAYRAGLLDYADSEGIDTDELEGEDSCG